MIDQTSQFFAILTSVGAAKLANANALGVPWKLTEMGLGDANGTDPIPSAAQTSLINEWRRRPLNQLFIDPVNPAVIVAEQVIPADEGGRWIREIALYDADGDLVAVANCPPSFKPIMSQGSGRTQVVRMNIIVSSTGNITLKIDPSVVLATREFVERRILEELYKLDNKQSVRAATTANIALSGLKTIDGISLLAGDRVLVKNQAAAKENGIYLAGVAAWQRAPDADSSDEVTSALILSVEQGTTQADTRWQLITDGTVVLGTTALTFQNITQGFAPLNSPALIGVPTAPTAAPGVNTGQIATTAFVKAALTAVGLGDVSLLSVIPDLDDVTFPSGIHYVSGGATLNNPVPSANAVVIHRIYGGGGLQILQAYGNSNLLWRRRNITQWEPWNSLASLDSPAFVGTPLAPTPAMFDSTKKLATTEFVERAKGNYRSIINATTTSTLIAATAFGSMVSMIGTFNLTLPAANSGSSGGTISFRNRGAGTVTIVCAGTDTIKSGTENKATITVPSAANLELTTDGASGWWASGSAQFLDASDLQASQVEAEAGISPSKWMSPLRVAQAIATRVAKIATLAQVNAGSGDDVIVTPYKLRIGFMASFNANGYIVFPQWLGGWIIQWVTSSAVAPSAAGSANWPIAFPNSVLHALAAPLGVGANTQAGNVVRGAISNTGVNLYNWGPISASACIWAIGA